MSVQVFWGIIGVAISFGMAAVIRFAPSYAIAAALPYAVILFLAIVGVVFGDPRDINKPK